MNWEELVNERKVWVDKNFPPDVYEHSLLGMIEEMGELTHHYLKMEQGIRGSIEEHMKEIYDAIGDITIYMFGVMWHQNVYPHPEYRQFVLSGSPIDGIQGLMFRLNYEIATLAERSRFPSESEISNICHLLDKLAGSYGLDYEDIVQSTWNKVKQRDWTKNKQDGDASAPDPEYDREEEQMFPGLMDRMSERDPNA